MIGERLLPSAKAPRQVQERTRAGLYFAVHLRDKIRSDGSESVRVQNNAFQNDFE